ncbi:MAG: NAD(P)/FAD-dependent oxidoreductase [Clostridia bacterium]|nr:MAG: NAD(P)/FAD-dependent oxidoreductase [Clostridia bacterium]
MAKNIVLIGGGPAATAAVEAIMEAGCRDPVVLVSDEAGPVNCRCLLSRVVSGEMAVGEMGWRPESFYRDMGVEAIWEERAVRIDPRARRVELAGGQWLEYRALLLATGASPVRPAVPGAELPGIHTLRTGADAMAIGRAADTAREAVVVGGGLVGLEAAEAFASRGVAVTVVEAREHLMPEQLDARAGEMLAASLKALGVEVRCGAAVASFVPGAGGRGLAVELAGGGSLTAGLVVLATGVRPVIELAAGAGAEIRQGVIVDEHMQTSLSDVYAAGDVAEVYDPVLEKNVVPGTWNVAVAQGRVAGRNMAGVPASYRPCLTAMHAGQIAGLAFAVVGQANVPEEGAFEVHTMYRAEPPVYRRLVLKDGRLVGALLVGDVSRAGVYQAYVARKYRVSAGDRDDLLHGRAVLPLSLPLISGDLRKGVHNRCLNVL